MARWGMRRTLFAVDVGGIELSRAVRLAGLPRQKITSRRITETPARSGFDNQLPSVLMNEVDNVTKATFPRSSRRSAMERGCRSEGSPTALTPVPTGDSQLDDRSPLPRCRCRTRCDLNSEMPGRIIFGEFTGNRLAYFEIPLTPDG
jgi:hypothetical protein